MTESTALRLDIWLWAARFFKTRSLAVEAIDAGHVRRASVGSISGDRLKPAHIVKLGDVYAINRGDIVMEVRVLAAAERRGSASDAAQLFEETPESLLARARRQADRVATSVQPVTHGRPTKHNRRKLAELFAKNYAGSPYLGDE